MNDTSKASIKVRYKKPYRRIMEEKIGRELRDDEVVHVIVYQRITGQPLAVHAPPFPEVVRHRLEVDQVPVDHASMVCPDSVHPPLLVLDAVDAVIPQKASIEIHDELEDLIHGAVDVEEEGRVGVGDEYDNGADAEDREHHGGRGGEGSDAFERS